MGLFDRFIKRERGKQDDEKSMAQTNDSRALFDPNDIENAIAMHMQDVSLSDCFKIPFQEIMALGSGFASIVPAFRTISQTATVSGVGYIPINMAPGDLLKKAKGGFYWGAHVNAEGESIMTKWIKAGPATVETETILPMDPSMLIVAAMLVSINRKLDDIQEISQQILSFLERDKQAEMQANLSFLDGILTGYQHNWDNVQYKTNHHIKVLDIKQSSEHNIVFYQARIADQIKKLPALHLGQNLNSTVRSLAAQFRNYRIALYLFAYASFLEVMLLGNFHDDYLDQIADKVSKYASHYQEQFTQTVDFVKKYSDETVEKQVMGGLANAGKTIGKLIASNPVLSKGPVDEWLQGGGEMLSKTNQMNTEKTMGILATEEQIGCDLFVDSIHKVEDICNRTTGILFDGEALYLASAE